MTPPRSLSCPNVTVNHGSGGADYSSGRVPRKVDDMAKKKVMKSRVKKKRRKIQGRDWHGWACKLEDGSLCHFAEPEKRTPINDGKWVRVKFVEVD